MKGSKTEVNYMNAYLPKDLFTQGGLTDVASALDSMSVGTVTTTTVEPKGNDGTQYISTFKLVGTKTTPDSMQICQFAVDSKALADSIVNAVKGGKSVSELAKQHNDLVQKYSLKGDTIVNANPLLCRRQGIHRQRRLCLHGHLPDAGRHRSLLHRAEPADGTAHLCRDAGALQQGAEHEVQRRRGEIPDYLLAGDL